MKKAYIILAIPVIILFTQCYGKDNLPAAGWVTDSEKFALEYPLVGGSNMFVIRTVEQTAEILEKGTGVVFLGFKECSWCQLYAVLLHDAARENDIKRIFYCDIREDRQNNTESYQRIVGILDGLLQYDDEGKPRIYVPDVTIIENGKIISRDFETSKVTLGYASAGEYWNEERIAALKNRLGAGMKQIAASIGTDCNSCD
ncbi:MAG: hypothetical protein FWD26_07495 [Treponema sp.]|nr:hypothetical protein [Treponema sp.]